MTYVLIYWILAAYSVGGGFQTGNATFGDQAACEAALDHIKTDWTARAPNGGTYGVAGGDCSPYATPAPVVTK